MLRFFAVALVSLTLGGAAAAQVRNGGPPVPFADSGACPFEGCRYATWRANATLSVYASRSAGAPVVFRLTRGDAVTAVTGIVITEVAGQVRFRDSVTLATGSTKIHIEPRDTLFLLSYEGEGFTTAWFKGPLYRSVDGAMAFFNGVCSARPERCIGRIVVPERRAWWVYVRNAAGLAGWTNEPDRFDGKDALGAP